MPKEFHQPSDDEIRTHAYFLWQADGCPPGRDWDYWLRAKEELCEQREKPAGSKRAAVTAAGENGRKRGPRNPMYV